MTDIKGIDIAWDRPSIQTIKATGAEWVARYFSTDPTKNWKPGEVAEYVAAGLACVGVYETTTTRATQGHAAGVSDAQSAVAQAHAAGFAADQPIYFAVDEDTSWSSVAPYFEGVASVIGTHRVGVYGGFHVIEGAYAAGYRYLWQTLAWSGGQWSVHNTITQPGGTAINGNADIDYAKMADYGQFPRPTNGDWLLSVTPQDLDQVANRMKAGDVRDEYAAATLYWLQRALDPSIPLDPKNTAWPVQQALALRALLGGKEKADETTEAALKAELDAVKTAVAAVAASLDALTKAGSATAAEVEQGVQAELVKLGQALGGIK